jgi:hypothetical protein
MPWIIAGCVVLLVVSLTLLFIASARLILRDMNDRFDRVRVQLEHAANAVVNDLVDDGTGPHRRISSGG